MNELENFIKAKTDQLNADDLMGGPITVRITKVVFKGSEQPCHVYFEGDAGKPYKPGKSMGRVMTAAWGKDYNLWAGESMTLYRDPEVKMKGMAVGGIRISHMTRLQRPLTMPLTATRGVKSLFTVQPLREDGTPRRAELSPEEKAAAAKAKADEIISSIAKAESAEEVSKVLSDNAVMLERLQTNYSAEYERIADARDFKTESFAGQS